MAGRPTKLTADAQKRVVAAVAAGATYERAAACGGVNYNTFNEWMKKGEQQKSGAYHEFYEDVKRVEAQAAARWLGYIEKAAQEGTWQAAAWKLERRYPNTWGRTTQTVEHKGAVALNITKISEARDDDGAGDWDGEEG